MSSYEKLSSAELRKKLLEFGYDLPVSINKDFMIKKLEQVAPSPNQHFLQGQPSSSMVNKVNPIQLIPNHPINNSPVAKGSAAGIKQRSTRASMNKTGYNEGIVMPTQEVPPTIIQTPKAAKSRGSINKMMQQQQQYPQLLPESMSPATSKQVGSSSSRKSKSVTPRSKARTSCAPYEKPIPENPSGITAADFSRDISGATDSISNMFGLIVPGRIVQADFTRNQEIENEPSKFKIDIPNADMIDHVVVFLTGTEPFPLGKAGQIYFGWPDMRNEITWHLLGHITNERPSAIFKISELKKNVVNPGQLHHTMTSFTSQGQQGNGTMGHTAQIGISVEFLEVILESYSPQMLL